MTPAEMATAPTVDDMLLAKRILTRLRESTEHSDRRQSYVAEEIAKSRGSADAPRCPSCGAREQQHCIGVKRNEACEWEKRR